MSPTVLLAAWHEGPRRALAALVPALAAEALRPSWVGAPSGAAPCETTAWDDVRLTEGGPAEWLRRRHPAAVIAGTSDAPPSTNPEHHLVCAARALDVPVFRVEDVPGNYQAHAGERLDLLFVEDDASAELQARRGLHRQAVAALGNPRYAALPVAEAPRLRAATRARLGLDAQRTVLWVGQPDGPGSHETLMRLAPALQEAADALLFRAHPRDAWYPSRYGGWLSRVREWVLDVSTEPDALSLVCAADLVVTQYSSIGTEALYLGTPTVWALFEDVGRRALQRDKGYAVPPACASPAWLINDPVHAAPRLREALGDAALREGLRRQAAERLVWQRGSPGRIVQRIQQALGVLSAAAA